MAEYGIQTVPDGIPPDAGNGDKQAPTLVEAIAEAMARFGELQGDTYGQGSIIGDPMAVPYNPFQPE